MPKFGYQESPYCTGYFNVGQVTGRIERTINDKSFANGSLLLSLSQFFVQTSVQMFAIHQDIVTHHLAQIDHGFSVTML